MAGLPADFALTPVSDCLGPLPSNGYDTGIIGGSGMRVLPLIVFSVIATLVAACTGSDDGPGSLTAHINGSLNTQMGVGSDSLRR
jgi:hypothetical protein